jgi:hypothetical protein
MVKNDPSPPPLPYIYNRTHDAFCNSVLLNLRHGNIPTKGNQGQHTQRIFNIKSGMVIMLTLTAFVLLLYIAAALWAIWITQPNREDE